MQAANTGLTGGSTPFGKDYDRSIVIINTLRINSIQVIENGKQIIALPGSSLYDLENKLKPLRKRTTFCYWFNINWSIYCRRRM